MGSQYRSVIFAQSKEQEETAKQLMQDIEAAGIFDKELSTTMEGPDVFYEAEQFHQDYLLKNPLGYSCHFVRKDLDFSKVA